MADRKQYGSSYIPDCPLCQGTNGGHYQTCPSYGGEKADERGSAEPNPWRQAIDEALIVSGLDLSGPNEAPKAALSRLIAWQEEMVLNPQISERAAALVARCCHKTVLKRCEGCPYT